MTGRRPFPDGKPPQPTGALRRYVPWVDVARGLAIVLVVVGHALRGLRPTGLLDADLFAAIDARIYAFHMPLFFMIAGFFFFDGARGATAYRRVGRSVARVLWPMVVWTYVFLTIRALAGPAANTQTDFAAVLVVPVPGVLHLWFLWALWLLQIAMILLTAPWRGARVPTFALAAFLAAAFPLSLVPLPEGAARWIGPALVHAPFFVAGPILYRGLVRFEPGTPAALAAALGFLAILAFWAGPSGGPLPGPVLAFVLSSLVLVVSRWIGGRTGGAMRPLRWLAAFSLSIYVMHTIFSAGLRAAFLSLGWTSPGVLVAAMVLVGLTLPILVSRAIGRTSAGRLLGLSHAGPPPIVARDETVASGAEKADRRAGSGAVRED